jgi:hypothetical protein
VYKKEHRRTLTTSAVAPSAEGFSRHIPVQYKDTGEPQRSIGDKLLPYHKSFSILLEIESDLFALVIIGVKSKA